MRAPYLLAGILVLALGSDARAHFALDAPPAYSMQDSLGLPEKSAPCGQADPGTPVVPTNVVTSFHAGDTITVTIDEKIFHPGHYRVALATAQAGLPADPVVTAGDTPCGTAQIEDSSTPGVLVDNMLPHTTAFSAPQSFQVTLPAGMTCDNCTLQVIEFMSDHGLNNPGGCFYHHCAQVTILPPGAPLPDAGAGADAGTSPKKSSGGCAVGGSAGALLALAGLAVAVRRRRR
ncbi:MAG TPA: SCE4755 family polysaccharide monooxygenase-like protein [Kofleriaceae bacterium]|nr:SCE4755 family polysaccharide monooxygenase-like protein [Kofleriaceae bacterium]